MSIDRTYTSEMGNFLQDLHDSTPESEAQKAEKTKYDKINELRDNAQEDAEKSKIWEDF